MVNKKVDSYHDLVVWQKSHELGLEIFQIVTKFPKKDQGFLSNKLRESVINIPSNIAVGFEKRSKKAKVHYYRVALTETAQLRYLLVLTQDLGYHKGTSELLESCENIERMLKRLVRSNASQ